MKYFVQIWALGAYPKIEIEQKNYSELKIAQKSLAGALAIEEKYELLISNYLDLEKECLNISANDMVINTSNYAGFFDIRLALNRRVVNLLTSTKLYIDQIQNHVRLCLPDDLSIKEKIKLLLSKEYDSFFEYRFMEALRNYVQHRGLAVHCTCHNRKWTSQEKDKEIEYKTSIFTHKSEIDRDTGFKKKVLDEMPEKVDLMYAVRSYVESISLVHCSVRELITQTSKESRDIIEKIIQDYKNINNGNALGLHAICSVMYEPSNESIERFPLILDWDDVRIKLIEKNSKLVNLRKRYVSSSFHSK